MAKKANQAQADAQANQTAQDEQAAADAAAAENAGHVNTTDNVDGSQPEPVDPDAEVNEAPAPDDVNDPGVQESQPEPAPEDTTASPVTEAQLTAEDPTATAPAGSADATADHTADGPHNGTENTLPQSPVHQGDLSDEDQLAIAKEYQENGAVVGRIAEKYGVTPERVEEIAEAHLADTRDERQADSAEDDE